MTPVALTIAGSDSGGGAGIQADLAAFRAFGVHGTSAITAVTAQNTVAIGAIHAVPPAILAAQIEAVLTDFSVLAIKIGMVPSPAHARVIAKALEGIACPVVLDPVISASIGQVLGRDGMPAALREHLLPLASCLTPNLSEAAVLLGTTQANCEDAMREQARALLGLGARHVLLKGGHAPLDAAVDILAAGSDIHRFAAPWIDTPNLHGTGCALSAAIAANLAGGQTMVEAVRQAKIWLRRNLAAGIDQRIGHGAGPAIQPGLR